MTEVQASRKQKTKGDEATYRAVRTPPHLLQLELFHSRLIGSDSRTLDADIVLLDGLGGVHGDLVVGGISGLETQIKVLDVEREVWENELKKSGLV